MVKRHLSRRDLFRIAGALGLAACDTGKPQQGVLGKMENWNRGVESKIYDPGNLQTPGAVTPEMAFPIYHASPQIPMAPAGWKLKIGGRVKKPREFSVDDLMGLPKTTARIEHHCVEGWSAIAEWTGVQLAYIATICEAEKVDYVEFKSFDAGYWSSWDRDSALHPQTLLAYGMNGHPRAPAHGAPVRIYGAVKLGYKQVKYLTEVNFLDHETGGYWENRGYEWFGGT